MKTKIVDAPVVQTVSARTAAKLTSLLLLLVSAALGAGGCTDRYYATAPYYGPGYAGPAPYYGAGYGVSSTSVAVAVEDRPYYTHGPGYYVGSAYYAWRPGHWSRYSHRWIPGHYVLVSR
ncbi:MAG TPA: hypothetical protein VE758_00430 [Chthoniobacterales bacterium]|nr:hypothetical protein [Chthoniobacterales bacterium]